MFKGWLLPALLLVTNQVLAIVVLKNAVQWTFLMIQTTVLIAQGTYLFFMNRSMG